MDVSRVLRAAITTGLPAGNVAYEHLFPGPDRLGSIGPHAPATANPVVIVPGFSNNAGFMDVWKRSLAADGFRPFTFDDPDHCLGDLRTAATRLSGFVDNVRAQTGARQVDLVTYSAGVTTARAWMALNGGAQKVHSFVNLDGSWDGDNDTRFLQTVSSVPLIGHTLYGAIPTSELDLQQSSDLYRDIHQHPAIPDGVHVTSIYPARLALTGAVDGATNIEVPGNPGHIAMARSSSAAYEAARAALLAANAA